MIENPILRGCVLPSGVCLATLTLANPAFAQSNTSTAPAGTAEAPDVNEIIVTAQKRSENVQNVPIAITALSPKEIGSSGVTGVEDLRFAAPHFAGGNRSRPRPSAHADRGKIGGDRLFRFLHSYGAEQPLYPRQSAC